MAMTGFTPVGGRTPARRSLEMGDYFGDEAALASGADTPLEADFVDNNESIGDVDEYIAAHLADEEIRAMAQNAAERGLGFGGMVDRLFGMSLFGVEEDTDEQDEGELREELEKEKRQRILDKQMIMSAPKPRVVEPPKQQEGEEGGWKDAAWLFSVASKVIL